MASGRKQISKKIISTLPNQGESITLKSQILRSARMQSSGSVSELMNPNSTNRAHLIMQQRDMFYQHNSGFNKQ